ncbi:hypothetical protein Val02_82650 [Virgisporangium aliadipatigenens]|uniref:Uncharacterized protein n=1 Tax=Virgisporangium aliadipatigenens TaxID=741659 RepID=A0A8J3YT46_9ACTN|nr:hypothetical protein Val02_82650 [Virgisporangium aliadipatigenens]
MRQAARRLPQRPNEGPTSGLAFDVSGRALSAQPWSSGRNVASTSGLRPLPGPKGFPWTLTDHLEAIVAQEMRKPNAPREVVLVSNNEPCVGDPYGCDRVARHIIPQGSRLTIYIRDPETTAGVRLLGTYEGTGKEIA